GDLAELRRRPEHLEPLDDLPVLARVVIDEAHRQEVEIRPVLELPGHQHPSLPRSDEDRAYLLLRRIRGRPALVLGVEPHGYPDPDQAEEGQDRVDEQHPPGELSSSDQSDQADPGKEGRGNRHALPKGNRLPQSNEAPGVAPKPESPENA